MSDDCLLLFVGLFSEECLVVKSNDIYIKYVTDKSVGGEYVTVGATKDTPLNKKNKTHTQTHAKHMIPRAEHGEESVHHPAFNGQGLGPLLSNFEMSRADAEDDLVVS